MNTIGRGRANRNGAAPWGACAVRLAAIVFFAAMLAAPQSPAHATERMPPSADRIAPAPCGGGCMHMSGCTVDPQVRDGVATAQPQPRTPALILLPVPESMLPATAPGAITAFIGDAGPPLEPRYLTTTRLRL